MTGDSADSIPKLRQERPILTGLSSLDKIWELGVCARMCAYICVCICMCMSVCERVCTYVYMYIRVHTCLCVSARMWQSHEVGGELLAWSGRRQGLSSDPQAQPLWWDCFLGDISSLPMSAPLPVSTSKSPRAQTLKCHWFLLEGSANKEFPLLVFLPLRSNQGTQLRPQQLSRGTGTPKPCPVFLRETPENLRDFRVGHLSLLGPQAAGLPPFVDRVSCSPGWHGILCS